MSSRRRPRRRAAWRVGDHADRRPSRPTVRRRLTSACRCLSRSSAW